MTAVDRAHRADTQTRPQAPTVALTPAQLDEALTEAGLPLWSQRGDGCPVELSYLPNRWARHGAVALSVTHDSAADAARFALFYVTLARIVGGSAVAAALTSGCVEIVGGNEAVVYLPGIVMTEGRP